MRAAAGRSNGLIAESDARVSMPGAATSNRETSCVRMCELSLGALTKCGSYPHVQTRVWEWKCQESNLFTPRRLLQP